MTPAFESLRQQLKQLPGLGYRSAERLALHLLVERRDSLEPLLAALQEASSRVRACPICGNLAEAERCELCADPRRDGSILCVVEQVTDLVAMERAGAYRGLYHVLHGRLSPMNQVGPEQLNLAVLQNRLASGEIREVILALSNDLEGEATCHFLREEFFGDPALRVSRIGFGLPSGGGLLYADATTLRSALEGRRDIS